MTTKSGDFDGSDWRDWLPPMMRIWASQYARILEGGRLLPNIDGTESWHFDGWPLATVLGKIKIEGEGASQGHGSQHFAEVYTGEGRIIWLAMQGLRYDLRAVIYGKYLSRSPWREVATALNIARTAYWDKHNQAHAYIAGRVPLLSSHGGDVNDSA